MTTLEANRPTILEDTRVLLRPLSETDFEHLLDISEREPENWTFGLQSAAGANNLKKYIETALEGSREGHSYPFILFDKKTSAYAGSTRYYQINLAQKRLAIGYSWIGNEFKQTGLNTHVKYLMLTHAFDELSMERVEFMADTENLSSIKSILSLGAQREGTLRSHAFRLNGTRRDTAVFSILKQEWLEHVKPFLYRKVDAL